MAALRPRRSRAYFTSHCHTNTRPAPENAGRLPFPKCSAIGEKEFRSDNEKIYFFTDKQYNTAKHVAYIPYWFNALTANDAFP